MENLKKHGQRILNGITDGGPRTKNFAIYIYNIQDEEKVGFLSEYFNSLFMCLFINSLKSFACIQVKGPVQMGTGPDEPFLSFK